MLGRAPYCNRRLCNTCFTMVSIIIGGNRRGRIQTNLMSAQNKYQGRMETSLTEARPCYMAKDDVWSPLVSRREDRLSKVRVLPNS